MKKELIGSSVFGLNDIYQKFKEYKLNMIKRRNKIPPLYVATLDVRAAFDKVRQNLMMDILDTIVTKVLFISFSFFIIISF
jgi:hypothetical protein